MPTSTTNFGLSKPLVNDPTDQDLWGNELNSDLDSLDGLLLTCLNWTPSVKTATFSVTIPTAGSTTTGSAKVLYLCNATSGAIVPALPAVATASGLTVAFKKSDSSANSITITGNSTDNIDGANTYVLSTQYNFVMLECDGTQWNIIGQSATGTIKTVKQQTFPSSGTYTPSTGMLYCIVDAVDGGAGGGGVKSSGSFSAVAAGGYGGAYGRVRLTAAQIGASKTVTIGAGGAGGANTGGNGVSGGATSLGSLLVGAAAAAGAGSTNATNGQAVSPTSNGSSFGTADFSIPQKKPGLGIVNASGSSYAFGSNGGDSIWGDGGNAGTAAGVSAAAAFAGGNGNGYGAGGAGAIAYAISTGAAGGNGANGYMIITEYCSQ